MDTDGLQRPSVDAASLLRGAPLGDKRFWMIQSLVVVVTVIHTLVEYSESRGELSGFLRALHNLPVEAYILPVVLAGWWFGLSGGVLTGSLTLALSLPNLVLFHRSDFEWLGELGAVAFVIGVGVLVAYMTESEARSRRVAVATSRRLETLHDVTSVLNRYGDPASMVGAVIDKLRRVDGVESVRFVPSGGFRVGPAETRRSSPGASTPYGDDDSGSADAVAEVSTPQAVLGSLHLRCSHPQPCLEDAGLLSHVAHELAIALEHVRMLERERDQLQGYARAMTDAQERERRRIARDLHDGPAQSLVVLVRGLGRLAGTDTPDADPSADAGDLREVARQALHAIRRTTHALRPALLDDLGLVPAIESLIDRHRQRHNATVELDVTGDLRRLPDDVELAAFRIVQEALSNIEHHAATATVRVGVRYDAQQVHVMIADDGPGFDPSRLEVHEQFGLMGMRERAESVGGDVGIESHVGSGTTVTFRAPG